MKTDENQAIESKSMRDQRNQRDQRDQSDLKLLKSLPQIFSRITDHLSRIVAGQLDCIQRLILSLLIGRHIHIVGHPGTGKTLLVKSLIELTDLTSARIQCTPDLNASSVFVQRSPIVKWAANPIHCLMVDDLMYASPSVLASLTQVMSESGLRGVDGMYQFGSPLTLFATSTSRRQNQQLPASVRELFLFQIELNTPLHKAEAFTIKQRIIRGDSDTTNPKEINLDQLKRIQSAIIKVPVTEEVSERAVQIVRGTRPEKSEERIKRPRRISTRTAQISEGASTSAIRDLILAAQCQAVIQGHLIPEISDIDQLAPDVLSHRVSFDTHQSHSQLASRNQIRRMIEAL